MSDENKRIINLKFEKYITCRKIKKDLEMFINNENTTNDVYSTSLILKLYHNNCKKRSIFL
jgi:hypothetical protein